MRRMSKHLVGACIALAGISAIGIECAVVYHPDVDNGYMRDEIADAFHLRIVGERVLNNIRKAYSEHENFTSVFTDANVEKMLPAFARTLYLNRYAPVKETLEKLRDVDVENNIMNDDRVSRTKIENMAISKDRPIIEMDDTGSSSIQKNILTNLIQSVTDAPQIPLNSSSYMNLATAGVTDYSHCITDADVLVAKLRGIYKLKREKMHASTGVNILEEEAVKERLQGLNEAHILQQYQYDNKKQFEYCAIMTALQYGHRDEFLPLLLSLSEGVKHGIMATINLNDDDLPSTVSVKFAKACAESFSFWSQSNIKIDSNVEERYNNGYYFKVENDSNSYMGSLNSDPEGWDHPENVFEYTDKQIKKEKYGDMCDESVYPHINKIQDLLLGTKKCVVNAHYSGRSHVYPLLDPSKLGEDADEVQALHLKRVCSAMLKRKLFKDASEVDVNVSNEKILDSKLEWQKKYNEQVLSQHANYIASTCLSGTNTLNKKISNLPQKKKDIVLSFMSNKGLPPSNTTIEDIDKVSGIIEDKEIVDILKKHVQVQGYLDGVDLGFRTGGLASNEIGTNITAIVRGKCFLMKGKTIKFTKSQVNDMMVANMANKTCAIEDIPVMEKVNTVFSIIAIGANGDTNVVARLNALPQEAKDIIGTTVEPVMPLTPTEAAKVVITSLEKCKNNDIRDAVSHVQAYPIFKQVLNPPNHIFTKAVLPLLAVAGAVGAALLYKYPPKKVQKLIRDKHSTN